MPRLHVLGSGGWVPTPQRQTSCYLLETRRSLIFFDAGTGLSRLHDPLFQRMLERHSRAVVLLSHWHQDHIEGLHYLPFFLGHMEVVLAAPGDIITGVPAAELLERYGGDPFLPEPFSRWPGRFEKGFSVQEIKPGANKVLGEEIIATVQPHVGPTLGYRVRDVCYVTDTCVRDETLALADGVSLLIHDAYLDDEEAERRPELAQVHGVATGAARLAAAGGIKDLLLGHLNPAFDPQRLDRMLIKSCEVFPRTLLGSDMMVIDVKGAEKEAPSETAVGDDAPDAPAEGAGEKASDDLARAEPSG